MKQTTSHLRLLLGLAFLFAAIVALFVNFDTASANQPEVHTVYLPHVVSHATTGGTEPAPQPTTPPASPTPPPPVPPVATPPPVATTSAMVTLNCADETTLTLEVDGQRWENKLVSVYWNDIIQGQLMPKQDGSLQGTYAHHRPQNGLHVVRLDNGTTQIEIQEEVSCLNIEEPVEPTPEPTPQPLPDLTISQPVLVGGDEASRETAVTVAVTITNNSDITLYEMIFIDLFIDPSAVHADYIELAESDAFMMITAIAAHESKVVTFNLTNGLPENASVIYAMIDTARLIGEADELNNVSAPLELTQ